MSVAKKTFLGGSFLSVSEVVNQACAMVRNIILARFLTKEDFGIAALLALILTLFEMTGKMALSQQLIQSKYGDEPAYVDSIHFTQLVLGAVSSLLILMCAWPLAHFVTGPQYISSLLLLGLIPLINGLNHLEVYRRTRKLSYGPVVLAEMIPQVLTTVAAWPLTVYFKDYRAVLWLLLGKSLLSIVITHLLADRRFTPRYHRDWLIESLKFGWPLLLAGFIQMGNFQGDSMVVAARYTLAQLGEYSVALTMAMTPSVALLRISHSIALPLLSEVQGDLAKITERYARYVEIMAFLSCAATLGMLFCGEQVIILFYGTKYTGVGSLACLLTAAQGIRIIRGATVGVTMAKSDTVNILMANVWRLSGLALAALVGWLQASMALFALTAFVGEVIALVFTTVKLHKQHAIPPMVTIKPTLLATICVLVAAILHRIVPIGTALWWNWPLLILALISGFAVFMFFLLPMRFACIGFILKLNTRLGSPLPQSWLSANTQI